MKAYQLNYRRIVRERSGGQCEAFLEHGNLAGRCPNKAVEIHHRLKRSRGGKSLDRAGETYHLIHLCSRCHRAADDQETYENGMVIAGEVIWDQILDRPVYLGPDEYLKEKYPAG